MKVAFFDCFSGAAGDMIVAACLDAGASAEQLQNELAKLSFSEKVRIEIEKVTKKGFQATRFSPLAESSHHSHSPHRGLKDITSLIEGSSLSAAIKQQARRIFERLAHAEAKVHGVTLDQIHFHEVGAVDSILDIVGACVALELLGVEKVFCSSLVVGCGTVQTQHGLLPVPAPATAELIKGIEVVGTSVAAELLTPTGAAILTTLAERFGPLPSLRLDAVGYGAGTLDTPGMPNVLRLLVGQMDAAVDEDEVVVLEANIDDATGEVLGYVIDRLWEQGALDVFCNPIQMKKNRPAVQLSVICSSDKKIILESVLFAESTTFGVRWYSCRRSVLQRDHRSVNTPYGTIRIKLGSRQNRVVSVSPEFSDCQSAAIAYKVPLKEVMAAAMSAYRQLS